MAISINDFKKKYLGKQVEYHSYGTNAFNQCVDLVNTYIHECLDSNAGDYTEIIGTNAKDFKNKFDPDDFDFIVNTTSPNVVPEKGDIVVWNDKVGNGAGHVAIVLEANNKTFKSLDQNWSKKETVTEETHNYNNVSGWLRPKKCPFVRMELEAMRDSRDFWKKENEKAETRAETVEKRLHTATETIETLRDVISTNKTPISEYSLSELISGIISKLPFKVPEKGTISQEVKDNECKNEVGKS